MAACMAFCGRTMKPAGTNFSDSLGVSTLMDVQFYFTRATVFILYTLQLFVTSASTTAKLPLSSEKRCYSGSIKDAT